MKPGEALRRIQAALRSGEYFIRAHAKGRMKGRSFQVVDIEHAVANCGSCVAGQESNRWELTGPDEDGRRFKMIWEISGDCILVTVLPRQGMKR